MSRIDDGGPAFPRPMSHDGNGSRAEAFSAHEGMSLRDWFAGQALAGMLADPDVGCTPEHAHKFVGVVAIEAYQMADAMLAARKPKTEA